MSYHLGLRYGLKAVHLVLRNRRKAVIAFGALVGFAGKGVAAVVKDIRR